MTSNTTPSGEAVSYPLLDGTSYEAWKAFNNTNNDLKDCAVMGNGNTLVSSQTYYLQYTFPADHIVRRILIANRNGGDQYNVAKFRFQGSNDDLVWTTLLEATNPNGDSVETTFNIQNKTKYSKYRLLVLSNYVVPGKTFADYYVSIAKLQMYGI